MSIRVTSDRGATFVEAIIGYSAITIVVVCGVFFGVRFLNESFAETHHATVVEGKAFTHESENGSAAGATPVSVNVAAAATVVDLSDACPQTPGVQPTSFDCSLPVYVKALELSGSSLKARYTCADGANYEVLGGQAQEDGKKCILKTAAADG